MSFCELEQDEWAAQQTSLTPVKGSEIQITDPLSPSKLSALEQLTKLPSLNHALQTTPCIASLATPGLAVTSRAIQLPATVCALRTVSQMVQTAHARTLKRRGTRLRKATRVRAHQRRTLRLGIQRARYQHIPPVVTGRSDTARATYRERMRRTASWCDTLPSPADLRNQHRASPAVDSPRYVQKSSNPSLLIVKHIAKVIQRAQFEATHAAPTAWLDEPTEIRRVTLAPGTLKNIVLQPTRRAPRQVFLNSGLVLPRIYASFCESLAIDVTAMPLTRTADLVHTSGTVSSVLIQQAGDSTGTPGITPLSWPASYNWGATVFSVITTPRTFLGYLGFAEQLTCGRYTLRQSNGICIPAKVRLVTENNF